ncbi:MAG: DUF1275 domain-containing protein [Lachnospiraceae bacterium]|nr:DUF1275 domain-containing protein [Lachnospiraceae bacterium]
MAESGEFKEKTIRAEVAAIKAEEVPKEKLRSVLLECEKPWVYLMLISAAGWFGAYTYLLRGGVFCNAQTANVVIFAVSLGTRDWMRALYLLLPISAYYLGALASELLGRAVKRFHFLRWETVLVGLEIFSVLVIGFLPKEAPDQIAQVTFNFICSMQFNTFRQVEGVSAATTFVTNHIRELGYNTARLIRHHEQKYARKVWLHGRLLLCFILGAIVSAVACQIFGLYSIWGSGIILLVVFIRLCIADRSYEKDELARIPKGH